ncbi:DivIVA domain-containing protein [Plantactinospora sp. S1510]|uniref:DivIVA domain-containing protein n=1 Tax=Plantactinospora alkalitolerans TaxID=2789879 RepID=A0ABS0H9L3_9ACTN|nr:DivIVA domain-containing protein [Plantactinospora alkalitolerans]MBF9134956.1 DivIVA domain-containing protein [Plantactinospora alkalitolerans]
MKRLVSWPGAGAVATGSSLYGVLADPARLGAELFGKSTFERDTDEVYGSRPEGGVGWCCGWGACGRTAEWWWSAVSAVYPGMTSADIRAARFGRRSWRRGLDPDEVYAFLLRIADEVELLRSDARVARDDADRVKVAPRNWQTRNTRACDARWRGDRR